MTPDTEELCPWDPAASFAGSALAPSRPGAALLVKMGVDSALALILLIATAPVVCLALLAVRLSSAGPAIYVQVRLGKRGHAYKLYKIRTMWHNCEAGSGPCWSNRKDPRVIPVGWLLRRTHIDELPQLWNVLRGQMSLVGPRPERPEFLPSLEQAMPNYRNRLLVRPGIAGLAQVQLPPDTDLDSVRRKLAYDLYYISRWSLWLDLRILIATALHVSGFSYAATRRLCGLPGERVVERPLVELDADSAPLTQAFPA